MALSTGAADSRSCASGLQVNVRYSKEEGIHIKTGADEVNI
jgi:hypothetical protein